MAGSVRPSTRKVIDPDCPGAAARAVRIAWAKTEDPPFAGDASGATAGDASNTSSSTFNSGQLVRHMSAGEGLITQKTGNASGQQGAIGSPESGNYIGWGYWAQGSRSVGENTQSLLDVHYVVARPTPELSMPKFGQVAYGLTSGTTPTATRDGVTTQGQLISGNLVADFTVSQIKPNRRPRKCLGYRTPHEVFYAMEMQPHKLPSDALCT